MRIETRAQAIWAAVLITLGAVVASVILAAIAVPVTGFEPDWHHWFFATVIPLILAPFFIVPLVYANFRLVKLHRQVERMALTDSLTGLPNRRAFFRKAARAFAKADTLSVPVAVMIIDVDHFKRINDSHGHVVGDDMIGKIAVSIRQAVEACESSAEAFSARIGGDEFAVVLASADRDAILAVARRIGDDVRRVGCFEPSANIATSVSIGVALREPGEDIDGVLAAADQAAYKAKHAGRDCFVLAEGGEDERTTPQRARSQSRAA